MALVENNQFGQVYEWGIKDSDAPVIAGLKVRRLELKYEPEVESKAQDGEGHVESVTTSKPDKRMITATASGYISDLSQYTAASASFSFRSRFFIVRSVSEPRNKGEYVEGVVEAYSHAGVSN